MGDLYFTCCAALWQFISVCSNMHKDECNIWGMDSPFEGWHNDHYSLNVWSDSNSIFIAMPRGDLFNLLPSELSALYTHIVNKKWGSWPFLLLTLASVNIFVKNEFEEEIFYVIFFLFILYYYLPFLDGSKKTLHDIFAFNSNSPQIEHIYKNTNTKK